MRELISLIATTLLAVAPVSSYATTWVWDKVRDTVGNSRVKVQQPASSGSYTYQWPEKSDQGLRRSYHGDTLAP